MNPYRNLKSRLGALVRSTLTPARLAHAHSGTDSYAYVLVGDGAITGNVQFPIAALNGVIGLSLPQAQTDALAGMTANRETIEAYAAEHFKIGTAKSDWLIEFTGHRVLERKAGSYAILEYRTSQHLDPVPRSFTVSFDGIIHAQAHHEALVIVKTWAGFGALRTETEQRLSYSADQTSRLVTIPEGSVVNDLAGAFGCATSSSKEFIRRARKRLRRLTAGS